MENTGQSCNAPTRMIVPKNRQNEALEIAKDAVDIKAKVLWLQLGIKSEQAKKLVIKNKIEYIEDRCTKMEYQKYFLKIRQAFPVLQD